MNSSKLGYRLTLTPKYDQLFTAFLHDEAIITARLSSERIRLITSGLRITFRIRLFHYYVARHVLPPLLTPANCNHTFLVETSSQVYDQLLSNLCRYLNCVMSIGILQDIFQC